MRKRFLIMISLIALINLTFIVMAFAQEELTGEAIAEETITEEAVVEEELPFDEAPESGGLEMFARKIVGSGLVDIFIQGGFVMYPILLLVIWGLATVIWKIISLNYAKINLKDFLDKLIPLVADIMKQSNFVKKLKDLLQLLCIWVF